MDTKRLRGILRKYRGREKMIGRNFAEDQAIKEIQELCEPMSQEEIEKIISKTLHRNRGLQVHGVNMIEAVAHALVGKLPTPRLKIEGDVIKKFPWETDEVAKSQEPRLTERNDNAKV